MKTFLITLIFACAALACTLLLMTRSCKGLQLSVQHSQQPIPECLLLPSQGLRVLYTRLMGKKIEPELGVYTRYSNSHRAISHAELPQNPFMGSHGNNMHNDSYISDVNAAPGPLGKSPGVQSRTQGFGGYGTLTFDRKGRIVTVFGNAREFQLELLDPNTLDELASFDLPPRSIYFPLQGVMPWKYLGAGMYFYLDHKDRVVLPTTDNRLVVIQTPENPAENGFELVAEYDLSSHIVQLPWPKLDSVAWVMPGWQGKYYWYATIEGLVGAIDKETAEVMTWKHGDEVIENSFAVGEEGVFVMSDEAMYRLNVRDQQIVVDWREPYDKGPFQKPGHITRGSGTSVTLVGSAENGLVVATDNAAPRIHLELYRRSDGVKICRLPLFRKNQSGTDLSALAFEHADQDGKPTGHYSIMIENNYGHHTFPTPDPHPGIARVDAIPTDSSYQCKQIWETEEAGIAGAKLSLNNGLLYMYSSDNSPAMANYFTAIDFNSGKVTFRQHTGMGHGYNAWQGVLFLHPYNGALYSTTIFGLIKMQDSED